jgi:hypothetical protein
MQSIGVLVFGTTTYSTYTFNSLEEEESQRLDLPVPIKEDERGGGAG